VTNNFSADFQAEEYNRGNRRTLQSMPVFSNASFSKHRTSLLTCRQARQLASERIGTIRHGVLTLTTHDKSPCFQLVYMTNDRSG
jgi:hypothetical protein